MSEWNGVPQNPERDGWHWLRHRDASFCTPVEWRHPGGWVANNIPLLPNEVQRFVIDCCEYLGPCLMPEKIAAKDARIAELEAALRPFSEMFLYPDDLGFEVAEDIKSDPDWCSDANDLQDENLFVLRGDIRKARVALEGGKKDE